MRSVRRYVNWEEVYPVPFVNKVRDPHSAIQDLLVPEDVANRYDAAKAEWDEVCKVIEKLWNEQHPEKPSR